MNFVIAGIIVILIMLCIVAGFMLALIKKLETLEDSLDVIKFGVKDVIHGNDELIKNEIHSMIDIVERLIDIEKEFDSNIAKGTTDLVEVCRNHLCAIEDRCKGTEQMVANCTASIAGTAEAVKSLRESTDALEDQVTTITDIVREYNLKPDMTDKYCGRCQYQFNAIGDPPCRDCHEASNFVEGYDLEYNVDPSTVCNGETE